MAKYKIRYKVVVNFIVYAENDMDAKKKIEAIETHGLHGQIDKIIRLDEY